MAGAGVGAIAGTGAQASKIVLKILYKSSSEYLEILETVIGMKVMRSLVPEGLAGY